MTSSPGRLHRVGSFLARFGRAWRRHWPLSPAGLGLALVAAALLALGRAQMDIVLTLVGMFWLALTALAGLLNGLAAALAQLELRRASGAGHAELQLHEGRATATGLALRRRRVPLAAGPRWRWDGTAVEVEVEAERRDGHVAWTERVRPRERDLLPGLVRELQQEDLLGLWRLRGRVPDPREVVILPDSGRLAATDLAACLASGDLLPFPWGPAKGDMVDARPYTAGDPARLILWKVYARTRQLLVRTPETARSPERQPLVYLVAGPDDDAAAGAARLLLESGLLGSGVRFAADGTPQATSDLEEARRAIAASVRHRDRGGQDLVRALAEPLLDPDDPVVLVVPAAAGPWTAVVLGLVARRPERFVVLAVGDAAPPPPRRTRWQRALLFAPPRAGRTWEQLRRAVAGLARSGARVVLADRRSGRVVALAGDSGGGLAALRSA